MFCFVGLLLVFLVGLCCCPSVLFHFVGELFVFVVLVFFISIKFSVVPFEKKEKKRKGKKGETN